MLPFRLIALILCDNMGITLLLHGTANCDYDCCLVMVKVRNESMELRLSWTFFSSLFRVTESCVIPLRRIMFGSTNFR